MVVITDITMSNTPQFANSPEGLTDTVVTTNQQDVDNAKPTRTTRAVNAYGISVLKGGNVLGSSFVNSVIDAYTNVLSYQPISTCLLILSFVFFYATIHHDNTMNPFFIMRESLYQTINNKNTSNFVSSMSSFCATILKTILPYDFEFATFCSFFFVYLAKPSSRNLLFSSILTVSVLVFKFNALSILFLSQLFFLYTQVRSPKHKALIVLFAVVTIIIGHKYLMQLSGIEEYYLPEVPANRDIPPPVNRDIPLTPQQPQPRVPSPNLQQKPPK